MKQINDILSNWPPTHHAYIVESSSDISQEIAEHILKDDTSYVYTKSYDTFKIDDARMIKSLQSEMTEKASIFVLHFTVINHQAQNALLKVLEEPTDQTYFILVCPSTKILLVTLQSRLQQVAYISNGNYLQASAINTQDFIKASLEERFECIKKYTDIKSKNEKLTKQQVYQLCNELEQYYADRRDDPHRIEVITILQEAKAMINKNGSSLKMILDLVAVNLS